MNLKNLNVQEMNMQELKSTEGGLGLTMANFNSLMGLRQLG